MILALFAAVAAVFYIVYLRSDRNDYKTRFESERKRVDDLCQKEQAKYDQLCQEAQEKYDALCEQEREWEEHIKREYEKFESYIDNGCDEYPHLAAIRADVLVTFFERSAEYLRTKPHPAHKEAQRINDLQQALYNAYEDKKLAEYNLQYILELEPDLKKLFDDQGRIRRGSGEIKKNLDVRSADIARKEAELNKRESELNAKVEEWRELWERHRDIVQAYSDLRTFERNLCISLRPMFTPSTIRNITDELLTPKFFFTGENSCFFTNNDPIFAHVCSTDDIYTTSLTSCTCPDYKKHKKTCKHMVWLASRIGALGLVAKPEQEAFIAKLRPTLKEIQQARDELQKEKEANKRVLAQIKKATAETTAAAT